MRRMFSEKQLKALISGMASKGELDFTDVDIKAKTVSQSQANWEVDIKSLLNPLVFKDTSTLYAKMCLYGNELSIVISGKFIAQTESNTYKGVISNKEIDIPNYIAEKIFRADGTSLKASPSSISGFNAIITAGMSVYQNPSVSSGSALLSSLSAKKLTLNVYGFGVTTEDAACYIDYRVQLLIA